MPNQNSLKEQILTVTESVRWFSFCERENVIRAGVQLSKDDTPGCTKEACSFRDANHEMQKRGTVVLGVSTDSVESHQEFADKYDLSFPLLSDTDASVSRCLRPPAHALCGHAGSCGGPPVCVL